MKEEYIKVISQMAKILDDLQFDLFICNETIKSLEQRLAEAEQKNK